MSSSESAPEAVRVTETGLFARNATGMVREVSQLSASILNFIPGCPTQALAAGLFFAFAAFPGGNFLLGLLLVAPMVLSFAYAFGLMSSAMPRSGGDYVIVSRVLHPAVGMISSLFTNFANMLSNAFFGIAFATIAVGPGLIIVGLIDGSSTLTRWGTTVETSQNWQFILGALMMVLGATMLAGGWTWALRWQNGMFILAMAGLAAAGIIALFTSHSSFISNFNDFARPYTHSQDTYHGVIATAQKAGVQTDPAFSISNTFPLIGVLAGFGIYSWWTAFIGGEVRQASTTRNARNMALAGIANLVSVAIFALIFLHTFGTSFLTAANGGGMPAEIPSPPFYFFLAAASFGHAWAAVFLVLSAAVFWPLIYYISLISTTRSVFAWSFDGLLPERATHLNERRAPMVSLVASLLVSFAFLYWGTHSSSFLQVFVYATLFALIGMMLVGLSALVFPYRRPEMYRASVTNRTFLGVPVVSIAGAGAVVSGVILYYILMHYAAFGVANRQRFILVTAGVVVFGVAYYAIARAVRAREGVDIARTYAEIPPE
jgi:basic amino acid/polyamine antiporter, APA family